jgi:RimJ/RimL family protein N-acetyltransferase
MPGSVFLRGDRVVLRTVEEDDLAFLRDNVDDPRVRRPLTGTEPTNMETTREHFEEYISAEEDLTLALCVDGDIRGTITLFGVDQRAGTAEVAYWLTPEAHGRGLMTEAARLLVGYAFEELRLRRVRGRALATNEASKGVLRNCGMQREAVGREAGTVDGEYVDMIHFGVLREEWEDADDP